MKKSIIYIFLLLLSYGAFAQARVQLTGSSQIVCSGQPFIVLNDICWQNHGAIEADQSTLVFSGNQVGTALFEDAFFNLYNDIIINRPNEELILQSAVDIEGSISFNAGNLFLNNQTVSFIDEMGGLKGEQANRFAFSPVGGQMIAGQLLTFPEKENVGQLGAIISAGGDLSYTEVRRGHGLYLTPGGHSIARWYRINSVAGQNVPTSIRFTYFEHELSGLNEATLQVWNSQDYGFSWQPVPTSNRNTSDNWIEVLGQGLSGLFTIAPTAGGLAPQGGEVHVESTNIKPLNWNAFPNPLVDQLTVQMESKITTDIQLIWLDATGRTIKTEAATLDAGTNTLIFDMTSLTPGTYFLKANHEAYPTQTLIKVPD